MTYRNLTRRIFAGSMIALLGLTTLTQARPIDLSILSPIAQQADKLPPVNWVRSRRVDIKHLDIDLRFDWEHSRALGVTTVTFAPFDDTDKLTLDAARMTINSVKSASGAPLKYTYDDKGDT